MYVPLINRHFQVKEMKCNLVWRKTSIFFMLYLKIFVSLWLKVRLTLNLRTKPDIEDTNQPVADQFSSIRKIIGLSLDNNIIHWFYSCTCQRWLFQAPEIYSSLFVLLTMCIEWFSLNSQLILTSEITPPWDWKYFSSIFHVLL